ncbi:ribonuclease H-like domain-containing protein [Tanacetum coccineum]
MRRFEAGRDYLLVEYWGVANAVAETCWLRNLLRELHTPLSTAILVYCDNVSSVYLSSNPVQHQRTKHIEIDIHFVHDLVAAGHIRVLHVPYHYQYTDIFTKCLPTVLFDEFRSSLSVRSSPAQTAGGFIRADIRTCNVSYDMLLILSGLSESSEMVHDVELHIRWRLLRVSEGKGRVYVHCTAGLGWPPAVAVVSVKYRKIFRKYLATKPTLAPPCDPSNRRCVGQSTSRAPCNYELQLPQVPPVGLVVCPSTRVHNGSSVEHNGLARDVYGNVSVVVLSISLKRQCIGAPSSTAFCDQQLPLPQLAPVGSTVFPNTCEHQSTLVPSRNINLHTSEASPANSHQSVSQSTAAVGGNICTISDSGNHAVRDCNEQDGQGRKGTLPLEGIPSVVDTIFFPDFDVIATLLARAEM